MILRFGEIVTIVCLPYRLVESSKAVVYMGTKKLDVFVQERAIDSCNGIVTRLGFGLHKSLHTLLVEKQCGTAQENTKRKVDFPGEGP